MENETIENQMLICSCCGDDIQKNWFAKYGKINLKNSMVKAAFPCQNPEGKDTFEHMWVEVIEDKGDVVRGILSNEPIMATDYDFGDTVEFTKEEISQHYNEQFSFEESEKEKRMMLAISHAKK